MNTLEKRLSKLEAKQAKIEIKIGKIKFKQLRKIMAEQNGNLILS